MAAPNVRALGTAVADTTGTITPTNPTHASGDILLMLVGSSANASVTPTHTMSSAMSTAGWALLASTANTSGTVRGRLSVFWLRADTNAETNPALTCTPTGATACVHLAAVTSVQNVLASGTPYENAQTNQAASTNSVSVTRTLSGNERDSWMVAYHADDVATGITENSPDAYNARYTVDDPTGIDGFLKAFEFNELSTLSDTITFTATAGGSGAGINGMAFALLPLGAATHELTGSGDQDWTFAGPFQVDRHLTGSADHDFVLAGPLQVDRHLAGSADHDFVLAGPFQVDRHLVGSADHDFILVGDLQADRLLTGLLASTYTLAGGPSTAIYHDITGTLAAMSYILASVSQADRHLAGSADHDFLLSGPFQVDRHLAGSADHDFLLVGPFQVDRHLAGSADHDFLLVGPFQVDRHLAGSADHDFLLAGALTTQQELSLFGLLGALHYVLSGSPSLDVQPTARQRTRFGFAEPTWKRYWGRSTYRR